MQTKNNSKLNFFKHLLAICCIVGVQVASVLSLGAVGGTQIVGAAGVIYPAGGVTTVYPVGTVTQCPATAPNACGSNCYSTNQYVCIDAAAGIMCPVTAPNRCGGACYSTSQYVCTVGGNLCAIDDFSCRGIAGTGVISTSKPIAGTAVYPGSAVYEQPQYAAGYTTGAVYPGTATYVNPNSVVYPAGVNGVVYPAGNNGVVYTTGTNGVVYPAAANGAVVYQQPDYVTSTGVSQPVVYPATNKPNVYYTNGGSAVAGAAVYPASTTTVVGGQVVYPTTVAAAGAATVYPANYANTIYPTGSKGY